MQKLKLKNNVNTYRIKNHANMHKLAILRFFLIEISQLLYRELSVSNEQIMNLHI